MEKLVKLSKENQKDLFIATLIHDLKNPLISQIIVLEQFYNEKYGKLSDSQKNIIKEIISSSQFMLELVSSILFVYKSENGTVKLNKEKVNIDNIINNCIKNIMSLANTHYIIIQYINNSKNKYLIVDEKYIKRVINNMLNNTVIYSYNHTKALVLVDEDEKYLKIHFKSKGIPISEDFKSHIFDKYNLGSSKKSGTGLGLYFCKKAIEAHGGSISLNTNDSDIEFCIKLPKKESGKSNIEFD